MLNPFQRKSILAISLPDYIITIIIFATGLVLTVVFISRSQSISQFLGMYDDPLIFSAYYLWIKSLVLDTKSLASKEIRTNFPGFFYWIYTSQWIILWMVSDMAYHSSRLNSITSTENSLLLRTYFSNPLIFWIVIDLISSILIYPLKFLLSHSRNITDYVILDYIKFILILVSAGSMFF